MQTPSLPPRRAGVSPSAELAARRASLAALPGYAFDERVTRSKENLGGVSCLMLTPPGAQGTLVYFHGGGFRLGTPDNLAAFGSQLAVRGGCRTVLPAYGLAPENPFPGPLHDGVTVLDHLDGDGAVLIGGDSAGGNIATGVTMLRAQRLGDRLRGLLLFSPWLDLSVEAGSYANNAATDPLFSRDSALQAAEFYLQGETAANALASPLFGDVAGFPPTLLIASGTEVLLDDSMAFAAKLAAANVAVSVHAIPNMMHVAATLSPDYEGAVLAMAIATSFLQQRASAA